MFFERIKSEGLAHNSYIIGSRGEAVVIDPRRDCQVYVHTARRNGLRIKRIFETHRNEDYVAGSVELNVAVGAEVYHGPGLKWQYGTTLQDGQEFGIGDLRLTAIHTPGHTDESMTYALVDSASGAATVMVFAGDALFVDEVGRTDLQGPEQAKRLASALYQSIHQRILPLGDGAILCPGHGGGSVCGSHISDRDESSLGIERAQNPVLQLTKKEFLRHKTLERLERPPYFTQMEKYNLEGPPLLGHRPAPPGLTPRQFRDEMARGAVVIDTRRPAEFCGTHISGSYAIWLDGLSEFAGWVLGYEKAVLLVLEDESLLDTAVRRLFRLGYDRTAGYLGGGIESWYDSGFPIEELPALSVHDLKDKLDRKEPLTVLDVRGGDEWNRGHIDGSLNVYVGHLEQSLSRVPRDKPVAVLCSVGNRAGLGASILLRAGYPKVYNVLGSMTAWRAAGFRVSTETT